MLKLEQFILICVLLLLTCFLSDVVGRNDDDDGKDLGYNEVCDKDEGCSDGGEKEKSKRKSNKELYAELRENLRSIRESCGEVCDTDKTGVPGKIGREILLYVYKMQRKKLIVC